MKKLVLFPLICLLVACDFETPYERAVRRAYNACLESVDVTETRGCDCIRHYSLEITDPEYQEALIARYSATYVELTERQEALLYHVALMLGLHCSGVPGY